MLKNTQSVIPAKAGIQALQRFARRWIPGSSPRMTSSNSRIANLKQYIKIWWLFNINCVQKRYFASKLLPKKYTEVIIFSQEMRFYLKRFGEIEILAGGRVTSLANRRAL